jgi:ribonuclease P protein subunit RPR2
MRKPGRKPKQWVQIASERMAILLDLAQEEVKDHPERSKRYIALMKKIGMRYNIRLQPHVKARICKKCGIYLVPGYNCRTRIIAKAVITECAACGHAEKKQCRPVLYKTKPKR